jgi:hypothetical protein
MEAMTQRLTLSGGESIVVTGSVLRAWGGDIVRQLATGGHHDSGAPLTGDELREANDILNGVTA